MSIPEPSRGLTYESRDSAVRALSRVITSIRPNNKHTWVYLFLPRDATLARLCNRGICRTVVMCLSVYQSQIGVLLKRLNVGSSKQCHTIAQELLFSADKIAAKFDLGHPQRGRGGVG